MKRILLFLLLCYCGTSNAQNYQCLQNNGKHFFTNGNGYLRGIKIDSVRITGDTTLYYPFHTPRGFYSDTSDILTALDTNGGSWLGKQVLQLNDGTFIFDSYWGNHVTIKTQANAGDSWVFYSDASTLYYQAQLLGVDTMSVLGSLDSVKRILITAHNPSGLVATDPLDSFKILLSKNHGFVQVFDLYTFPYHQPDSVYRSGLDFYLDRSTWNYGQINGFGGNQPDKTNAIFGIVDFINPNDVQLHDWNTGDIFEKKYGSGWASPYPPLNVVYNLDTIMNKVVATHRVTYSSRGSTSNFIFPTYETYHTTVINFSDTNFTIADTGHLPEQKIILNNNNNYVFYFPADTSWCRTAPLYITRDPGGYRNSGLGGHYGYSFYKLGVGQVLRLYMDGDPTYEEDALIYYKIAGNECGHNVWPLSIAAIPDAKTVRVFPNPAGYELNIAAAMKITKVDIFNPIGQKVLSTLNDSDTLKISVSSLPAGCYFVRLNDSYSVRFVKE